ncbi:hypothetical protein ABK040_012796 [Willaertia magna]
MPDYKNINDILCSPPSKACALLEEYYKSNTKLLNKDATTITKQDIEKICDLLDKEMDKKKLRLENIRILLRLIINITDFDKPTLLLLENNQLAKTLLKLFHLFEQYFQSKHYQSSSNTNTTLNNNNNTITTATVTATTTNEGNNNNTTEQQQMVTAAMEARETDQYEKMFSTLLCTTNSLCERNEGKKLYGSLFISSFVRVTIQYLIYDVFIRRQAAENINLLIKHSQENKSLLFKEDQLDYNVNVPNMEGEITKKEPLIKKLATSLLHAGDFGLQANITEIIYRLHIWKGLSDDELRKFVFSNFDDLCEKLIVIFKKIKSDNNQFVESIREFVMELNEQLNEDQRTVYSIQTDKLIIGNYECFPEWVDFGTKSMSCFLTYPNNNITKKGSNNNNHNSGDNNEERKELIDFDYTNIRTLRLSYKQHRLVLQLFNEIEGFENVYNADDDDQIIGIEMSKEALQFIKTNIAGIISVCREKNKLKEELLNQPPIPYAAIGISTANSTATTSGEEGTSQQPRKISTSIVALKASASNTNTVNDVNGNSNNNNNQKENQVNGTTTTTNNKKNKEVTIEEKKKELTAASSALDTSTISNNSNNKESKSNNKNNAASTIASTSKKTTTNTKNNKEDKNEEKNNTIQTRSRTKSLPAKSYVESDYEDNSDNDDVSPKKKKKRAAATTTKKNNNKTTTTANNKQTTKKKKEEEEKKKKDNKKSVTTINETATTTKKKSTSKEIGDLLEQVITSSEKKKNDNKKESKKEIVIDNNTSPELPRNSTLLEDDEPIEEDVTAGLGDDFGFKLDNWDKFFNNNNHDNTSMINNGNQTALNINTTNYSDIGGIESVSDGERTPIQPKQLFAEPSNIDTTFGGFNLDDDDDLEMSDNKDNEEEEDEGKSKKNKRNKKNKLLGKEEKKEKQGTKRKLRNISESESDFSSEMTAMFAAIMKKQQEKKKRKIEACKKEKLQQIKKTIEETKLKRIQEREKIAKGYKEGIQIVEESMVSLAKKMKASYSKFQQEITNQYQRHQELNSKLKALREAYEEKISLLKTKDQTEMSLLEKKVKKQIAELQQSISEINSSSGDISEKEKQLKALMSSLFK